ncbi:hypothetical protein PG991_010852 [Apiospora marii]|uniref:Uncharacterized protein n=1 Tax=Apiospora marii TaxID=335849 RepID=A0ABR1RCN0_9PEZI
MQSRFEPWWRSVRSGVLDPIFGRSLGLNMFLTKIPPVMSTRKQILGLFELVPAGRGFEKDTGSGWEPLCEFLGKKVPDMRFPQLNEGK